MQVELELTHEEMELNCSCTISLSTCFCMVLSLSLLVVAEGRDVYPNSSGSQCPPWLDHGNGRCYCKPFEPILLCAGEQDITVAYGECITSDESINKTVIADCPYFPNNLSEIYDDLRYTIPASVSLSDINSYVCSQFNREGRHCGRCISGYGPAPFLIGANVPCAKCDKHNYLWVIVLIFQLFMVTLLYFTCVLFECRGTSSPFSVMAYFYQIIVNEVTSNSAVFAQAKHVSEYLFATGFSVIALWNLDFFHDFLPAVCVSPSLSNAQVLLFDYLVAFLPVVLTVLSYIFIELHDRGVWLIVKTWKPFNLLLSRLKTEDWNPKRSILSTFATFLLLSYSKLLFTSVNLLYGVMVYDNEENIVVNSPVLYYDPTIKYFGSRHAPYILLSFTVITVFTFIPPFILILYPTKCFKRLLEKCGFSRWHSLSIVMDVFQGWYKDGTNGTYDYRSLSALYMVLRVCFASEFILVFMFQYKTRYDALSWYIPGLVHSGLGCFYLAARPYKKAWMSTVDGLVLLLMGTCSIFVTLDEYACGLALFLALLPVTVSCVYITYKLIARARSGVLCRHMLAAYHDAASDQPFQANLMSASVSIQRNNNKSSGYGSIS